MVGAAVVVTAVVAGAVAAPRAADVATGAAAAAEAPAGAALFPEHAVRLPAIRKAVVTSMIRSRFMSIPFHVMTFSLGMTPGRKTRCPPRITDP
jgi:hypothetical protein